MKTEQFNFMYELITHFGKWPYVSNKKIADVTTLRLALEKAIDVFKIDHSILNNDWFDNCINNSKALGGLPYWQDILLDRVLGDFKESYYCKKPLNALEIVTVLTVMLILVENNTSLPEIQAMTATDHIRDRASSFYTEFETDKESIRNVLRFYVSQCPITGNEVEDLFFFYVASYSNSEGEFKVKRKQEALGGMTFCVFYLGMFSEHAGDHFKAKQLYEIALLYYHKFYGGVVDSTLMLELFAFIVAIHCNDIVCFRDGKEPLRYVDASQLPEEILPDIYELYSETDRIYLFSILHLFEKQYSKTDDSTFEGLVAYLIKSIQWINS